MNFIMISPAVSKPTDKGVTTNTSHTAPGSSPASPLSTRSSPPHSQVVIRRTHDFPGASGHSTHCCGVAGRLLAAAAVVGVAGVAVIVSVVAGAARCVTCCFLFFLSPVSPIHLFLPCDFSRLAHFLRGSCGCSPHLLTVSRRPQVRSIVDSDPPSILPPCHVSVRQVALFMH